MVCGLKPAGRSRVRSRDTPDYNKQLIHDDVLKQCKVISGRGVKRGEPKNTPSTAMPVGRQGLWQPTGEATTFRCLGQSTPGLPCCVQRKFGV